MARVQRRRCGRSWERREGDRGERGDGVRRKGEGASPRFSPHISVCPSPSPPSLWGPTDRGRGTPRSWAACGPEVAAGGQEATAGALEAERVEAAAGAPEAERVQVQAPG
jgi:hypothetical protein